MSSSIGVSGSSQAAAQVTDRQAAAYSLLRRTLDMEQNAILQLLQSLPEASKGESVSGQQRRIDFYA